MAKIEYVDYEAIPAQATAMRTEGQNLNKEITNAYKSIADMHTNWYGKRYNELVKAFNNMRSQINDLLDLVVGDIPYTLEKVANNYSQSDKGSNVTSAKKTSPTKIAELTVSNDVGMKFITSQVQSTQNSVSKNFQKAKSKMESIESTYNKIEWTSEAATAFKTKFKALKTNIIKSFEDIDKQFKNLMQQALDDVQAAESANTVK